MIFSCGSRTFANKGARFQPKIFLKWVWSLLFLEQKVGALDPCSPGSATGNLALNMSRAQFIIFGALEYKNESIEH